MMRLILVATIALLGGSHALAQTTTSTTTVTSTTTPTDPAAPAKAATATATATAAKSSDRMICEREEVLGSRLQGRRVCKTASQWAQERQDARDAVMRAQTMRGCGSNGNQC